MNLVKMIVEQQECPRRNVRPAQPPRPGSAPLSGDELKGGQKRLEGRGANWLQRAFALPLAWLLLAAFCAFTGKAYAAEVVISNGRSHAVLVQWQLQSATPPYDYRPTQYYVVPAHSTLGPIYQPPMWYGLQAINVNAVAADGAYPRTVPIGVSFAGTSSGAFDGRVELAIFSDAYTQITYLPEHVAPAGASSEGIAAPMLWGPLVAGMSLLVVPLTIVALYRALRAGVNVGGALT